MEFVENGEREREVHTCSVSERHLELSPLTLVVTRHATISSGITLDNLGVISLSCYFQQMTLNYLSKMKKELKTLMHTIRIYSQEIDMKFDLEKCAMLVMKNGKRHMTD